MRSIRFILASFLLGVLLFLAAIGRLVRRR